MTVYTFQTCDIKNDNSWIKGPDREGGEVGGGGKGAGGRGGVGRAGGVGGREETQTTTIKMEHPLFFTVMISSTIILDEIFHAEKTP